MPPLQQQFTPSRPALASTVPRPDRRRRASAVVGAALAAGVLIGPPGAMGVTASALAVTTAAVAPAAHAVPAAQVELVDTAGVIDPAALRRGLADVEFREPTRVVVYTERGADLSALSDDAASQEFNGRVLLSLIHI